MDGEGLMGTSITMEKRYHDNGIFIRVLRSFDTVGGFKSLLKDMHSNHRAPESESSYVDCGEDSYADEMASPIVPEGNFEREFYQSFQPGHVPVLIRQPGPSQLSPVQPHLQQNGRNHPKQIIEPNNEILAHSSGFAKNGRPYSKHQPEPSVETVTYTTAAGIVKKPKPTYTDLHAVYPCYECPARCQGSEGYREHLMNMHGLSFLNFHPCQQCGSIASSHKNMKIHEKNVHSNIGDFKCNLCKYTTKSPAYLQAHMRDRHIKPNGKKCDYCDKVFQAKSYLERHINQVHKKVRRFFCNTCNLGFYVESNLRRHKENVHLKEYKYHCNICKKGFTSETYLNDHMKSPHKLSCPSCPMTFVTHGYLHQHEVAEHGKKEEKKVKKKQTPCKICKKLFSSRGLEIHMRKCHNLSCKLCGEKFQIKESLEEHMTMAHSEPPEPKHKVCLVCGKTFNSSASLSHHKTRKHPELLRMPKLNALVHVQMSCSICKKKFVNSQLYNRHKSRPHDDICILCGNQYASKLDLEKHILDAHDESAIGDVKNIQD